MSVLDNSSGEIVELPPGRAEEFVRERTTTSVATKLPGVAQVPVLWILGLGGVALWLLTRNR